MAENAPTTRPVVAAIARVMAEVGSVEKRGENSFHRYTYATAADIAHALQKRMAEAGLVIVPYQGELRFLEEGSVLAVDFAFEVVHMSGDRLEERPRFTGMSSCKNTKGGFDDKALNKCLTAATKYFTLHLFRIPTGDYADADGEPDKAAPEPKFYRPPTPAQPAGPVKSPEKAPPELKKASPAPAKGEPLPAWVDAHCRRLLGASEYLQDFYGSPPATAPEELIRRMAKDVKELCAAKTRQDFEGTNAAHLIDALDRAVDEQNTLAADDPALPVGVGRG